MAETSGIEWTDATWNPIRGCTKISPGCAHCYAEVLSHRNPAVLGEWGPNGVRVVAAEKSWGDPVRWAKRHLARVRAGEVEPRSLRIFTASLADVFEDHPVVEGVRTRIWRETIPALSAIRLPDGRPAAVLLLLTKRANIAAPWYAARGCPDVVWPGVTVEDQQRASERIPLMLGLPRLWLSVEPLLGPLDLTRIMDHTPATYVSVRNALTGQRGTMGGIDPGGPAISWVIVGGESGPNARPMHPAWVRSLRDQCVAAGVPFFFKQWGEWAPAEHYRKPDGLYAVRDGTQAHPVDGEPVLLRVGKKAAGRLLDGVEWSEVPNG